MKNLFHFFLISIKEFIPKFLGQLLGMFSVSLRALNC